MAKARYFRHNSSFKSNGHNVTQHNSISDANPSQHLTGGELQSVSPKDVTLEPGLYVIATPIGNLRDITLRALDTLRAADVILAEDTRQTRKLLDAYDIQTPLTPYHDHNAAKRVPGVIKDLEAGKNVALVSDAGTPLVSDPGFKLVRAAVAAGIDVFPLPGASAVLAGLVKSGLPSDRFLFAGFLPARSAARKTALEDLNAVKATLIFFETGPRIAACLKDMRDILGARDVVLTRELTKRYEEARHGDFEALISSVKAEPPRGELVLLVGPPKMGDRWNEEEVISALKVQISELGVKRASAEIAGQCGWPKRDVYQLALKLK
jgi:16S rRNA (cytidine1402-2'-O)-methyltransferase